MIYCLIALIGIVMTLLLMSMFDGGDFNSESGKIGGSGGASGEDTKSSSETKSSAKATDEEKRLNQLDLELREAIQPGLVSSNVDSLALAGKLLKGEALPGYLQKLPGGIDESVISDLTSKGIQDVRTGMQSQGILDSGTTAALSAKTAGDIRTNVAQYNLDNLMKLLQIAFGGGASSTGNAIQSSQSLSQRLAGLRQNTSVTLGETNKTAWNASGNFEYATPGQKK